jgi:aminopeptidase YwaD
LDPKPARSPAPYLPLIAALLLLPLAAAACRSGAPDGAAPSPAATATGAPAPTAAATATETPSPAALQPQFDSARALETVRVLSVDIGSRPAGSEAERLAAQYLKRELLAYGYPSRVQQFSFEAYDTSGTALRVTSPQPRQPGASPLNGSASGDARGLLLPAGIGRPQEMPADAAGNILIIQRGILTFTDKVRNAEAAGAAGVVIFNNEPGPFTGQLSPASNIPAVTISHEDGQALLAMLDSGPVAVELKVRIQLRRETSQNVIAEPPGGSPCEVVAGAHYDSVPAGPGANDNASGAAVVMEVARARAAAGALGGVCYVLFGAEEIGLLGSGHYVRNLPDEQLAALTGMLNFDMLGVGARWPFTGAPELSRKAGEEAERLGLLYSVTSSLPENVGSDHFHFLEAGIPSVIFNCFCDPRYHTADDRFEFVQQDRLEAAGLMALRLIERLLAE